MKCPNCRSEMYPQHDCIAVLRDRNLRLEKCILDVNDILFDACQNDDEHMIECHSNGIADRLRYLSTETNKAFEVLQVVIRDDLTIIDRIK
jgi:hypothetical protein